MAHANRKPITVYLTDEEREQLTHYAKKIGISRQKLIANLVDTGLDDLKLMECFGILTIGKGVRDLLYKMKMEGVDSLNACRLNKID